MSRTLVWVTQPGRQRRLLHTITAASRFNSSPTLERLDLRDEQERQARILIEAWKRSGAKHVNSVYDIDQSAWDVGLRRRSA